MTSLGARLFVGLTALVLAACLIAGSVTYRWAFEEAIELQDAVLQQVGALALSNRLRVTPQARQPVEFEDQVVIEELSDAGPGKPDAPLRLDGGTNLPDGLQTLLQPSGYWRVLILTREDGSRVAIGQPTATRNETASGSALRAVLPLAALVPCLMVLVGVVIRYSFASVTRLARTLDAEHAAPTADLPTDGMPREVLPFIVSINGLLRRIRELFAQQRRFVADAAHELRTPITALSLQAENLAHADLAPDDRERLTALQAGIHRVAHLLEQLLALARSEADAQPEVVPVRLDEIVKDVVGELLPIAGRRDIDLGFVSIEPVVLAADAIGLRTLLRNLLDNALRHSPDRGQIDLTLRTVDASAVLTIDDQGPGIDERERERVFEPFVRGDHATGQGSGLGLSIVRRIVTAHGGHVSLTPIDDPPRSGTRAAVSLPLRTNPPETRSS